MHLEATTYHADVCNYLTEREPDLWRWAMSSMQDDLQQVRLHLLKTTYQLSSEAHPDLHAAASRAAHALGISPAISLYQSNDGSGANVAIFTAPDEAHIIFQGPVLGMLDSAEIDAVLGHELAHYLLWQRDGQRYWTTNRILDRLAHEESPPGVWANTALRYQQYTEIYADRGAYAVCGDIGPCIASLVKLETGTPQVHVESYLQQADRILTHESATGEHASHPQNFIRTRALELHAKGARGIGANSDAKTAAEIDAGTDAVIDTRIDARIAAGIDDRIDPGIDAGIDAGSYASIDAGNGAGLDASLAALLGGPVKLERLDILDQVELHRLTRSMLARLLTPSWFASDSVMALARRYYPDFQQGEPALPRHTNPQGAVLLPPRHQLGEFFSFVLLDFACIDPLLEDLPLAAALRSAEELGISEAFEALLLKETGIKKTVLAKLKTGRDELLSQATT